jgi:hypothetical protein
MCLLIFLLMVCPIAAQEVSFSGTWVLNHEKTELGGMSEIIIEIAQSATQIDYRQIIKQTKGEIVTRMLLATDGSEGFYTNQRDERLKCSCTLEEGRLIVRSESRQRRSGKWVLLKIEEVHSLSADGETLFVEHFEAWGGKKGKWPHPLVFDRMVSAEGMDVTREVQSSSGLFSKQQLVEDTRQLIDYLEHIHPDPYGYGGGKVAFHRRFQQILRSIPPEGLSKDEYIRLLRPFIASLADAHTAIATAYSIDKESPGGIPLSFASIEKLLYVKAVPSPEDKRLIGARLLSVEGIPFSDIFQRLYKVWGIENEYHGLLVLCQYLWYEPYLKDLLPEWTDTSRICVELGLPDGSTEILSFDLPRKITYPLIENDSGLELPSTETCDFVYSFLSPDKQTALLKVDGMTAYREMFETESMSRDVRQEAVAAYERFHGEKAPDNLASVIDGIPSAIETFKSLLVDMKDAGTGTLIVDLSENPGGNSIMADILTYFIYGKEQLVKIIAEELVVKKYSSSRFETLPGRSIEDINREYAAFQPYALAVDDYDFSYEQRVELVLSGKFDLDTGLRWKYAGVPSFLQEIISGQFGGYYRPANVIVTTSHDTFSSGFTFLRYLFKSGARVVGSTPGQSGNGFGNFMYVYLSHTNLRIAISMDTYVVFPEHPGERKVLPPHHELTYDHLKRYGFAPHAVIHYALDLLPEIRRLAARQDQPGRIEK